MQGNPDSPVSTCSTCGGTGVESKYNGIVTHPFGTMKIVDERQHPLHDLPGGQFYGGSSHHQCRSCKGLGQTL